MTLRRHARSCPVATARRKRAQKLARKLVPMSMKLYVFPSIPVLVLPIPIFPPS